MKKYILLFLILIPVTASAVTYTSPRHGVTQFEDIVAKGPWVDVRAYGAVCDSSTNDNAAFNLAEAAIPNGGTIVLPNGTCYMSTLLIETSRISFVGQGKDASKVLIADGANNGWTFSGVSFFSIDGVAFYGTESSTPSNTGINFKGGTSYGSISRSEFTNLSTALDIDDSYILRVSDNSFGKVGTAISISDATGTSSWHWIKSNVFGTNDITSSDLVSIDGVKIWVADNRFETVPTNNKRRSINVLAGSQEIQIKGNMFETSGNIKNVVSNILIADNDFSNCATYATDFGVILNHGGSSARVIGNKVREDSLHSTQYGIAVTSSPASVLIGNAVSYFSQGLRVNDNNNIVVGNSLSNNTVGIQGVSSGDSNVVRFNSFQSNDTDFTSSGWTNTVNNWSDETATSATNLGGYGTTNTGPINGATTGDFSGTVSFSGNVGINDATPDYLLDVGGDFGVSGTATFGGTVNFPTVGLIDSTGRVGIGSGNTYGRLHVSGAQNSGQMVTYLQAHASQSADILGVYDGSGSPVLLYHIDKEGNPIYVARTSAPTTPAEGMVAYADSANWNPGSGEGLYVYENGAWVSLKEQGGGASDHGALTGLADDDHGQYITTAELIPSNIGQAGATTGQVIKWDGSVWAPDADAGAASGASTAFKTITADSGGNSIANTAEDELAIEGGNGIDTASSTNETITISAETATLTNPGISELATTTEAITGTDTGRAVTPDALTDAMANYAQPLEATLTDIADGTIVENLVNTANPWADNEVADNISVDEATTATALAANGANCTAGSAPLGVDASGAAEGCYDVTTQSEMNSHIADTNAHHAPEPDASTTTKGIVELATTAETTTGTDTGRAVTPDGLEDGFDGSTNIDTLGTIGTGTWQGTDVDESYLDTNWAAGNIGSLAATTATVATTLDIPSGASCDSNAAGETCVDTTDEQLIYYGGSENVVSKYFTHGASLAGTYVENTGTIPLPGYTDPITIASLSCITDTGTVIIDLQEGSSTSYTSGTDVSSSPVTCDNNSASATTISNSVIDADDYMAIRIGTSSATKVTIRWKWSWNRQ